MKALLARLQEINLDERISELETYIQQNKHRGPDKIDKQVKALKSLRALKDSGITPYEAYTRETVPVIPAQFRAPIQLPNNTYMVPDVNDLLRNIGFIGDSLKGALDDLPPDELEKAKKNLYKSVEMLQGLETPEINRQIKKNYYSGISGSPGPAKSGFYQSALTRKRVDLSGRGVISPNPLLDMDQVEIPIDMGMTMYKPFVKRELISRGYSSDTANKMINKGDAIAIDALNRAGSNRPVIINRSPSITEGSMTAHYPTCVDKYNVNIPNVLAQFQLGDFDGDTMAIHVPISQKAIREAEAMMPSRNMYNDVADKIRGFPDHSAAIGLYILSKTKEGREAINKVLPDEYKVKNGLTKPELTRMLTEIAKEDSRAASVIVDELVRIGDGTAYERGFSFGLSDLEPLSAIRKELLNNIDRDMKHVKSSDSDSIREVYKKYSDIASSEINRHFENSENPVGDIVLSKARGSASQMRDLLFSPIAVDAADQIRKPIKHSYIEGLKPSEYFSGAAGARAGTLGKSQGTAQPGALGKILFSSTNSMVINKDKGESMGVRVVQVSDDPKDIVDRYIANDVIVNGEVIVPKGSPISPRVVQMLLKCKVKEIEVFTPLGSSSADGGIPAMAYGVISGNKLPEVGYNIGAHAAAGIVSPLYTESMQSFHTGKSLQDREAGYPRLKQILELTKTLPNKATLSTVEGTVSDISGDSLGGHSVKIEGIDHYINPGNNPTVRQGSFVRKGDAISDGSIDPREIAKLKDLRAAQEYMVDELVKNTPGNIKRRAAEVVVEGITRYAEILDPGESEYYPGDVKLISDLEKRNKDMDQGIKYEPVFKGVNTLPLYSQQWMSQLNFRNIKKSLSRAIATGASSDTHSYEPAAGLAIPVEFGEGEGGRY